MKKFSILLLLFLRITVSGQVDVGNITTKKDNKGVQAAEILALKSGSNNQNVDLNVAIKPITYSIGDGVTEVAVVGLPSGVTYNINSRVLTISGTPAETVELGLYNYTVTATGGHGTVSLTGGIALKDWTLAPNSYIFNHKDIADTNKDGLLIPVKKAFAMWRESDKLNRSFTGDLTGKLTATVYWQDVPGLIKTNSNYDLTITSETDLLDSVIQVPIDKSKGYGNAVVALHYGSTGVASSDPIIWSWHVWVTDDPTKGPSFGHTDDNGQPLEFVGSVNSADTKFIPKFMDRNLGAISSNIIGRNWHKSGGLMYQWGRKDPFPPLRNKDGGFYEISGEAGLISGTNYKLNLPSYLTVANDVKQNVGRAVNNPLHAIVNQKYENSSTPVTNVPNAFTWFGGDSTTDLWSDNSKGRLLKDSRPRGYQRKSPFDPCPNRWRIPSLLNGSPNFANTGYYLKYNPFGQDKKSVDVPESGLVIKPVGDNTVPNNTFKNMDGSEIAYYKGVKVFPQLGFDLSDIEGLDMGKYPGTGLVYPPGNRLDKNRNFVSSYNIYFDDMHEARIWTASIMNNGVSQKYQPSQIRFLPDAGNASHTPDPNRYPSLKGWYSIQNYAVFSSSMAACRCMEDPYYTTSVTNNSYYWDDFPVEYLKLGNSPKNYTEGLNNPNSYRKTISLQEQVVAIPISKAFSVYNQYLSDHGMPNYSNLKVKVLWSTTSNGQANGTPLINKLTLDRNPVSESDIKNVNINATVVAGQSGNAVVSLHDGNDDSILWSWHIWVTKSDPVEIEYTTEDDIQPPNSNYIGLTNSRYPAQKIIFMDRNLGATEAFPTIASFGNGQLPDIANITDDQMLQIQNSGGMQYQWGRKDPLPPFITPGADTQRNKGVPYVVLQSGIPDSYGNVVYAANALNDVSKAIYSSYTAPVADKYLTIRNNLKYSVNHPLTFMYPSNISKANDWLYSGSRAMPRRWGHATAKSPFDPCPKYWRVPDELLVNGISKGTSPMYYGRYAPSGAGRFAHGSMGLDQFASYPLKFNDNPYGIKYIKDGQSLIRYGYQFDNPNYKIGNFPLLSFRGGFNTSLSPAVVDDGLTYSKATGLWTGALDSNSNDTFGHGRALVFTHNFNVSVSTPIKPYIAMNVRCVKMGVIDTATGVPEIIENYSEQESMDEKSLISLFPNPTDDFIYLNTEEGESYELYDMSGELILTGKYERRVDVSELASGVYIFRLLGKDIDQTFKFIKD